MKTITVKGKVYELGKLYGRQRETKGGRAYFHGIYGNRDELAF